MSLHPSVNGGVGVGVGHRLAGVAHVQEGLQIVLPQPFGDQLILISTKLSFFTIQQRSKVYQITVKPIECDLFGQDQK